MPESAHVLRIDRLSVDYPGPGRAAPRRVLDGVSLDIPPGMTLGLVGESGSGKTTLGRAVLGLTPIAEGSIHLGGARVDTLPRRKRDPKDVQVVLQDPYTSLNPHFTIAEIIGEPLRRARVSNLDSRVAGLLDAVGLPASAADRSPAQFSGGQRQRVAIARAIAVRPRLIVCDEPVSALDLTTQSRILDLFLDLQRETGVAYLFVSHDLDVVRHISHEVAVLEGGSIVERGPAAEVTGNPSHPYTRRLLAASPVLDVDVQRERRSARRVASQLLTSDPGSIPLSESSRP